MANVYQNPAMRKTLSRFIRSQMELRGLTYKRICQQLVENFGIKHNPDTLRNKVSAGTLGSQMLFFMLLTMEVKTLDMDEIAKAYTRASEEIP